MERIKCFKCETHVEEGFPGYIRHLQYIHGFTINRGGGESGFACAEGACERRFSIFTSLRNHIQKTHFQNQIRKNADSGVGPENENVAIVTEVQNY